MQIELTNPHILINNDKNFKISLSTNKIVFYLRSNYVSKNGCAIKTVDSHTNWLYVEESYDEVKKLLKKARR